jgi:hypothetical protein
MGGPTFGCSAQYFSHRKQKWSGEMTSKYPKKTPIGKPKMPDYTKHAGRFYQSDHYIH